MSILLGILTIALVLVSFFLILVVLMQKAKSDGGLGSAMGGGMAEATFGADTGNVLSKATINAAVVFFVLGCGLYLGRIYERKHAAHPHSLPAISGAPALPPLPAAPPPSAAPASKPAPAASPAPGPAQKP